jgi:hypothetical protein
MDNFCTVQQELIVEYLNAVAAEQRAKNDEARAFAEVQVVVAKAATAQAVRAREAVHRRLWNHCMDHVCCSMADLCEIAVDPDVNNRGKEGYRTR